MEDQVIEDMEALDGFTAAAGILLIPGPAARYTAGGQLVMPAGSTLYVSDKTAAAVVGVAVPAVAALPGDAFTIMATAAVDAGAIQVAAGSVRVTGSPAAIADAVNLGAGGVLVGATPGTIVRTDGPLNWRLPLPGDWLTFTVSPGAPATFGTWTVGAGDTTVGTITADADGDASVWGGAAAGIGPFALPDLSLIHI